MKRKYLRKRKQLKRKKLCNHDIEFTGIHNYIFFFQIY